MSSEPGDEVNASIFAPTKLPCSGRTLRNKLVKVALYEHLAPINGGPPNELHHALYTKWAAGNWGMIITGNMQVCSDHLGVGRDVTVPEVLDENSLLPYKKLASCIIHGNPGTTKSLPDSERVLAVVQLCHTGRQAGNFGSGRPPFVPPKAPSAVPMDFRTTRRDVGTFTASALFKYFAQNVLFRTPQAMTIDDVNHVVNSFVNATRMAVKAGFDGVQIHAAHGYLITQFMSLKTNLRTDEYSVKRNPLRFLFRIVTSIRADSAIPKDFILGVKMNAADYVDSDAGVAAGEDRALNQLREIASWGLLDFIEVSGGDYEDPDFINEAKINPRKALFAGFSQRAVTAVEELSGGNDSTASGETQHRTRPLILLTGGLRNPEVMRSAISNHHADLLGVGRAAVTYPDLPRQLAKNPREPFQSIFPYYDFSSSSTPSKNRRAKVNLPLRYRLERLITSFILSVCDAIPLALKPDVPIVVGAGTVTARFNVLMRGLARGGEKKTYPGEGPAVLSRFLWYLAPGGQAIPLMRVLVLMVALLLGFWKWRS